MTTASVAASRPPCGRRQGDEARFREQVAVFADALLDRPPDELASRDVVAGACAAGLAKQRWEDGGDRYGVALIEALGRRGLTSSAVVVSLHIESVTGMLRQFALPALRPVVDGALVGSVIGCVAASEPAGGSDLGGVASTASKVAGGWRLRGEKKFVTLAAEADVAIVLARIRDGIDDGGLGAFVVPRDGYDVVKTHRLVAASRLATSWIQLDCVVPHHHLLGRPGLGLAVLNRGLTKERLAVVALVVGTCRLALALAVTHAMHRRQFGQRLMDHQAIRLRLADLDAQLHTLASDMQVLASGQPRPRRVAGLKVTAARFAERCLSECMHVFGGDGYVEEATPLGRLWRDIRLARIGGGTDEMMWELVAGGLSPDVEAYRRYVGSPPEYGQSTFDKEA